jgi:hypothetical protein
METQIFKASYFNHMPVAGQILDTASLISPRQHSEGKESRLRLGFIAASKQ